MMVMPPATGSKPRHVCLSSSYSLHPDGRRPGHLAVLLQHAHVVVTRLVTLLRGRIFPAETTLGRILARLLCMHHLAVAQDLDALNRSGAQHDHVQPRLVGA